MRYEIRIERAYDRSAPRFGRRLLVERRWPRGVSKAEREINAWMKDIAPSTELRRWFGHDPNRWDDFRVRYAAELEARSEAVAALLAGRVTFVYGSKEERFNSATGLRDYVDGLRGHGRQ